MTTTTSAMTMATMAVNDYGYSGDDGNDDDDDDDDDEDGNLFAKRIYIHALYPNGPHAAIQPKVSSMWADSAEGIVAVG